MESLYYIHICRNARVIAIPYRGVEAAWDAWENIYNAIAGTDASAELFDPSTGTVLATTSDI